MGVRVAVAAVVDVAVAAGDDTLLTEDLNNVNYC